MLGNKEYSTVTLQILQCFGLKNTALLDYWIQILQFLGLKNTELLHCWIQILQCLNIKEHHCYITEHRYCKYIHNSYIAEWQYKLCWRRKEENCCIFINLKKKKKTINVVFSLKSPPPTCWDLTIQHHGGGGEVRVQALTDSNDGKEIFQIVRIFKRKEILRYLYHDRHDPTPIYQWLPPAKPQVD